MFSSQQASRANAPAWLLLLLTIILAGNFWGLFTIGLLPDEAYYWVWSQRPELSYYDHPPLIAWLIRVFTEFLGNSSEVIRLPAILSWLVGAIVAYDFSRRLYADRFAGWLAVLVWSSLPIVQVGFHIATPDSALIIFSWLTYYFAYLAVAGENRSFWLLTGVSLGAAMLGKYPAVLVLAGLFLALVVSGDGRRQLAQPWPWLGAVLAFVVFSPVVIWNWQHDWVSFAFQFSHGVKESLPAPPLHMFMLFLGGQLLVAMPWTFFAMAWESIAGSGLQGYNRMLLGFGFWTPLVVFGLAGLTSGSGPNWPETAYVPGTILLAGFLLRWLSGDGRAQGSRSAAKVVLVVVLVLAGTVLMNLLRFPSWMQVLSGGNVTTQRTQLSQSYGWESVGAELHRILPQLQTRYGSDGQCRILLDNHARAGMVAWLLDAPNRVTVTADARISQYHVWGEVNNHAPLCLYIEKFEGHKLDPSRILTERVLPEGLWERLSLLRIESPDLAERWFAFYVPKSGQPDVNPLPAAE